MLPAKGSNHSASMHSVKEVQRGARIVATTSNVLIEMLVTSRPGVTGLESHTLGICAARCNPWSLSAISACLAELLCWAAGGSGEAAGQGSQLETSSAAGAGQPAKPVSA